MTARLSRRDLRIFLTHPIRHDDWSCTEKPTTVRIAANTDKSNGICVSVSAPVTTNHIVNKRNHGAKPKAQFKAKGNVGSHQQRRKSDS